MEEHPEWETKWRNDREKAQMRALGSEDQRKSRFDQTDKDGSGRSIRVQMRNTVKVEGAVGNSDFVSKTDSKDAALDEWMGKPQKAPVDVIDTQKFAEIVRQRHGAASKKEEDSLKSREVENDKSKSQPSTAIGRDREDGGLDRRRYERVEMQFSSRENRDRDRDRDSRYRDNRGGGRRR